MKKFVLLLSILLLCSIVGHAQEPEYDYWVYLPLVLQPAPTPTPTKTPTPTFTPLPPTSTPYPTSTPTLVPTSTPRPTRTPIPTSIPIPTSTPVPSRVHILPNHSYYITYNYLLIVGEVQNDTPNHLRFVKVAANVFDGNGQLLDTDRTYIRLDNLPPGEKTCFRLWFDEPAGWAYYSFEDPNYRTGGESLPNLTVLNDSGSYDPIYDDYEILGQVRNDHGVEVRFVSPVGTLYNAVGTVLDCDSTYVNSTHLNPGQASSFKMWFFMNTYANVTSYRVQVDGNPQ